MSSVSLVVTAGEMTEPLPWQTHSGSAVVYSARCPTREEGENEDSALLIEPRPGAVVLAMADGAGGHASGAHASRIAVNTLDQALRHADDVNETDTGHDIRRIVLDAMEKANQQICALGTGAATTLTVALIENQTIRTFQVGDSMVLVTGQRGHVRHRTIAHSPVGYAVEAGMLAEKEAIDHEDLHLVSNMAGTIDMHIEVGSTVTLWARDTVILGSDGLFDNAYQEEIIERIRKGSTLRAAQRLVELSRKRMINPSEGEPSKPDDLTFIVFRSNSITASVKGSRSATSASSPPDATTP